MENSEFGRLIAVLVSPAKTFAAIARRPTWVVALIVLTLLSGAIGMLALSKVDMGSAMRQQFEERGDMTPEQIDKASETMEKFGMFFALIGTATSVAIYFLLGLVFWVAFKLLGSELTYFSSLSTSLHGLMPNAIAALVAVPVILGRESLDLEAVQQGLLLSSSLAAFAPEDSGKALLALLSSLDVFSLWSLALLGIGFTQVAKVTRSTAWTTVIVLWLVYVLGKVGLSAAFS